MSLSEKRRQIRPLLDPREPADAQAIYYAFHHPDEKTGLVTSPEGGQPAEAYVCLSRTGMDLFRPLLTMRLPILSDDQVDPKSAAGLFHQALWPGTAVIISAPRRYYPILAALFDIQSEQEIRIMMLDQSRYEPIINVLVTQSETYNGLPRFIIRSNTVDQESGRGEIVASAGLNWRSEFFAEIYVHTKAPFRKRGYGRSVVAALVQHTLDSGRIPLYATNNDNAASIRLARAVGFVDTGKTDVLFEAVMKALPFL